MPLVQQNTLTIEKMQQSEHNMSVSTHLRHLDHFILTRLYVVNLCEFALSNTNKLNLSISAFEGIIKILLHIWIRVSICCGK